MNSIIWVAEKAHARVCHQSGPASCKCLQNTACGDQSASNGRTRAHPLSQSVCSPPSTPFQTCFMIGFRLLTSHEIASVMIGNIFIGNGASAQDSF
jgi:hypothetical protein